VFGFGPAPRIYVAAGATDVRKHFNGFYGLVRDHLGCAPESGHVFIYTNARRNRLKLVVYDDSGIGYARRNWTRAVFGGQMRIAR
jgi:transposase